jgi:3',5'-cyclic AMP phosphodiesterase CpdA
MPARSVAAVSLVILLGSAACGGAPPPPPVVIARPPEAGVVRLIVGGDSRDDSAHVLPWAFREAKARSAAAFLFLGDMELTPQLDNSFAEQLAWLDPVPFYPVLGNHEVKVLGFLSLGRHHAERSFRKRFLGTARTPVHSTFADRVVYSVDLPGGVHFVALDNVSQNGFGADQLAWLDDDLTRARATPSTRFVVAGMHKPLAHNGVTTHSMDHDGAQAIADSDAALALFVKHHVDVVVASHVHQFSKFVQAGIPSYITGGLGAPLTASGPEHAFHHFLELDVRESGITVEVVRFEGASRPAAKEGEGEDD